MLSDQKHSTSWYPMYPIQSSPSEDMWELPTNGSPTSSSVLEILEREEEQRHERYDDDHHVENFYTASTSSSVVVSPGSLSMSIQQHIESRNDIDNDTRNHHHSHHGKQKPVLGDATNTVRRKVSSPNNNTGRLLRRSHFN